MTLVRLLGKKYANKPRKKKTKKAKQKKKNNREKREIQKLVYSIKPKIT